MNLRGKKKEKENQLVEIWKKRIDLCHSRTEYAKLIERYNDNISTTLSELFSPVAEKTNMPIVIEVLDKSTNVHVDLNYYSNKHKLCPRISLGFPSIYHLLSSKQIIRDNIRILERDIRFLKKILGETQTVVSEHNRKNKILVSNPGTVSVIFNTKTRYF